MLSIVAACCIVTPTWIRGAERQGASAQPATILATAPPYLADPTGIRDSARSINAAISAAQAGDKVVLPAGNYMVQAAINMKSGIELFCQAGASISRHMQVSRQIQQIINIQGVNDVTVDGCQIRGDVTTPLETARQGIFVGPSKGPSHVRIQNCTFSGLDTGVKVGSTSDFITDVVIEHNVFNHPLYDAIQIGWYTDGIRVISNTVNGPLTGVGAGVYLAGCNRNAVVNGNIIRRPEYGIQAYLIDTCKGDVYGDAITHNEIFDSQHEGIYMNDASLTKGNKMHSLVISDNDVENSGESGIKVRGVSDSMISGNVVSGAHANGIVETYGPKVSSSSNTIVNNQVKQAGYNCYFSEKASGSTVTGNMAESCEHDGFAVTGSGQRVLGNTEQRAGAFGFELRSAGAIIAGNRAAENAKQDRFDAGGAALSAKNSWEGIGSPRGHASETSDCSLNQNQSGWVFDNRGADRPLTFVLPPNPKPGVSYVVSVQAQFGITVRASGGAWILEAGKRSAPNGSIMTSEKVAPNGNRVTVLAVGQNEWDAVSVAGQWSVN